jgi:hypothetical protein
MRLFGLVAGLALAACSSSTGPGAALTGTYVGDRIGLLAAARSAEVSIPCQIITLGPIVSGSDGTVQAAGTVTGSPKSLFNGRAARVSGVSNGSELTISVEWYVEGNWTVVESGPLVASPGSDHRIPASCIA